jgi:hypothetical protein
MITGVGMGGERRLALRRTMTGHAIPAMLTLAGQVTTSGHNFSRKPLRCPRECSQWRKKCFD